MTTLNKGKGKYDDNLTDALKSAGGSQGILLIVDGDKGAGFACQLSLESMAQMPDHLESIAAQMRQDVVNILSEQGQAND